MTAFEVLKSLEGRGVKVWTEAGMVKATPASALTAEDLAAVRQHKDEIVRRLLMPPHGSIGRPFVARGRRLDRCPFDGCAGEIAHHPTTNLKQCGECGIYFELLPPEMGVPV